MSTIDWFLAHHTFTPDTFQWAEDRKWMTLQQRIELAVKVKAAQNKYETEMKLHQFAQEIVSALPAA